MRRTLPSSLTAERMTTGTWRSASLGADRFERLQAVHDRHHQVEQDEIEGLALQDLEGLGAMNRLRDRPRRTRAR